MCLFCAFPSATCGSTTRCFTHLMGTWPYFLQFQVLCVALSVLRKSWSSGFTSHVTWSPGDKKRPCYLDGICFAEGGIKIVFSITFLFFILWISLSPYTISYLITYFSPSVVNSEKCLILTETKFSFGLMIHWLYWITPSTHMVQNTEEIPESILHASGYPEIYPLIEER